MTPKKQPFLYLGMVLLLVFVGSGQFLLRVIKPHYGEMVLPRMMARANHIYLLFIGLLVLVASQVDTKGYSVWIRRAINLGKALLVVSAAVLILAFFNDHSGNFDTRTTTLPGCILALLGSILIALRGFAPQRDDASNS